MSDDTGQRWQAAYALECAEKVKRALWPPADIDARRRAVLFVAGFADVDEDTAAHLLARHPGATDEALQDEERRQAICLTIARQLATDSYTQH